MDATNNNTFQQNAVQQRLILAAANEYAIFTTDLQRRVTSWNSGAQALFGYSAADMLGRSGDVLFVAEDRQQGVPQAEADKAQTEGRTENERWHLHQDGSRIYGSGVTTPLYDPTAAMNGLVTVMRDRTEQKHAQDVLRKSEQRFRLAIEAARMGTWEWDLENNEVYWNEQHFRLFGLEPRPNPLRPDDFFSHVRADERGRVGDLLQAAIAQGGTFDTEFWAQLADGSQRYMSGYGRVIEERGGQAIRMNGVMFDVTERRRAEDALRQSEERYRNLSKDLEERVQARTQELMQANQDLTRSNENLQQFAYVASHDLQEPLRKIQSFSHLLIRQLGGHPDDSVADTLQRITSAGARMSTLIEDLLTYSRISTHQQTFGPVSLRAIMAGVLDTLGWRIEQTGAQVQVDELPMVNGEEVQLSQLFQNLLSNALKFVPPEQVPQIHIQYVRRSVNELPAEVRPGRKVPLYHQISVHDEGIGFDTQYLDRIFQVFQRLHGKGQFAGTGVGLAICQRVVENHGGAITASSQPGEGATFCVYLPV